MSDPRTGDWIEWAGGDCPVDPDTQVDFQRRCDMGDNLAWRPEEFAAGDLRWAHNGKSTDIVLYRVLPPPQSRVMGIEQDKETS